MENPTMLVLWDIDLTLVDLRGLGASWYERALEDVLGVRLRQAPFFSGRTERSITSELLRAHGVEPTERLVQRMFDRLVEIADEQSGTLAERGHALPGAAGALEALHARPRVEQSLVTGNLRAVAERKLAAFSLDHHVDLDIGGYGAISEQRADLVAAAMANASAKHTTPFPPQQVFVVGDTPADVRAARQHGTVAVGVATGRHTENELRAAGATVVFANLCDTPAVLNMLNQATNVSSC